MAPHSADSTIVHEISALGQLTGLKKREKKCDPGLWRAMNRHVVQFNKWKGPDASIYFKQ